ncbi:unnamed protein product [Withania somnifera]
MEWKYCFSCSFLLFSCSILAGVSASASLSDGIFINLASTGRNLLQAKKPCPVSFEFQNYTVVTSQCRGPEYPAKPCCDAFVQFACPFEDYVNDLTNDCSSTMFSYINLHGKYPPECPDLPPSESADVNNSEMSCKQSPVLMSATALMGMLLLLF